MNDLDKILDLGHEAILLTLLLASPAVIVGLAVAIVVGVLQAATSIQEQTLSLIPKIVAMLLAVMLAGPWILSRLVEFGVRMFGTLP